MFEETHPQTQSLKEAFHHSRHSQPTCLIEQGKTSAFQGCRSSTKVIKEERVLEYSALHVVVW
jgi:hypothetical protein